MPAAIMSEKSEATASMTDDMAVTSETRAASGMKPNAWLELATCDAMATVVSHMASSI